MERIDTPRFREKFAGNYDYGPDFGRPAPVDGNGEDPTQHLRMLCQCLQQADACFGKVLAAYGSRAPMIQMQPLAAWKRTIQTLCRDVTSMAEHAHPVKHNPQTNGYDRQQFHPDLYRSKPAPADPTDPDAEAA